MKSFFCKNKTCLLAYSLLFYFYYYPITSSGLVYRDDYLRSFWNDLVWTDEGRYINKIIINLFTFTNGILTAPLTQFLSIVLISITIVYTASIIFRKADLFSTSILSLIFLNPFYLQNMSYGYDNLPMTFSVCCAVIASTSILKGKTYLLWTLLPIILILFSYQTTLGLYCSLLFFLLFRHYLYHGWQNINGIYGKALCSLASATVVSLIYEVIYPHLYPMNKDKAVLKLTALHPNITHIIHYLKLLVIPYSFLIPLLLVFTATALFLFYFKKNQPLKQKILQFITALLITAFLLMLFVINAEGPSIFQDYAINSTRIFTNISCLWLLVFYIISRFSKRAYFALYGAFFILCLSFSYSYGTFLRNQTRYFTTISNALYYDLSLYQEAKKDEIVAMNPFPLSFNNKKLLERNPLLGEIYGEQNLFWLSPYKLSLLFPNVSLKDYASLCSLIKDLKTNQDKISKTIERNDYAIYFYKQKIFVDFFTDSKIYDRCKS